MVDSILRKGRRPPGHQRFEGIPRHTNERAEFTPGTFDDFVIAPPIGFVVPEATERGPQQLFAGPGQVGPFRRELRTRGDGPLVVASPRAPPGN